MSNVLVLISNNSENIEAITITGVLRCGGVNVACCLIGLGFDLVAIEGTEKYLESRR